MEDLRSEKRITDSKNSETRTISVPLMEFRSIGGRKVQGRAIVFNQESKLLYENGKFFYERIAPSALDGIIARCDVFCTLNHDIKRGCLARSSYGTGSLLLKTDSRGLTYEFESPKTALGDELLEALSRGDIKGSSFQFCVGADGQIWETRSDGRSLRTVTKFHDLMDVSPCFSPAYNDTNVALVALRSFEKATPVKIEPRKAAPAKTRMSDAEAARLQKEQVKMLKEDRAEKLAKKGFYEDVSGGIHKLKF